MIPGSANPLLLISADSGYEIERSLRFNSADSAYLNRTPSSAGNRKTWTWSGWVKLADITAQQTVFAASTDGSNRVWLRFNAGPLELQFEESGATTNLNTTAVYRDPSAWYHIVVAVDTTQATSSNRSKIYVNGEQVTSFSVEQYPSQNYNTYVNGTNLHTIGSTSWSVPAVEADSYMADIHFIDGQALAPTDFGKTDDNGVWQAIDTAGLTFGTNGFRLKFADNSSNAALGTDSSGNSNTWTVNNLTTAAGLNPTAQQNFDVVTYAGNGSTQSITGLNFQPDFVWFKARSGTAGVGNHRVFDVVRGVQKQLLPNLTNAEGTDANTLTAFNSNGFSVGSSDAVNGSGTNYVAWCWKAGGAASSNTDGTITTSVSANTSYGFSITSYVGNQTAGATIGHGLNAEPKFAIIKSRDTALDWIVYHASTGNTGALRLNTTQALEVDSKWFNNTGPSSSTFTLGNTTGTNKSGDNMIAYMWSEVAGFSKFGTVSTGSDPVVVTGFKPRFLIVRRSDTGGNWNIFDTERSPGGTSQIWLEANSSGAENNNSNGQIEFLDNGFKLIGGDVDPSGGTAIYAAFAATLPDSAGIDSLVDTPSNAAEPTDTGAGGEVVGNYATLNPLDKSSSLTLSNGNLEADTTGGWHSVRATFGMSSGKRYWETQNKQTAGALIGIALSTATHGALGTAADGAWTWAGANVYINGTSSGTGLSNHASTDIVQYALDVDAGKLWFGRNGTWYDSSWGTTGNPSTGANPTVSGLSTTSTYFAAAALVGAGAIYNFGQRAFAYAAPSGYKALCTANLPEPTIADGSKYFDTKLYTGNGSSQNITSLQFQPDFVWVKSRSATGTPHLLVDSVRGVNKQLGSHSTGAETDYSGIGGCVSAFLSDGFSTGSNSDIATSGRTYAAWSWDGGSSTTTIAAGGLNSSAYNFGDWESMVTGAYASGWGTTYQTANAFDGNLATMVIPDGSQGWTFTPSTPIAGSTIEIYGWNDGCPNNGLVINGNNYGDALGADQTSGQWYTLPYSTLTSIQLTGDGSAGNTEFRLIAIRIDGKILIQTGTSVTNVPSIASTVRANPSAGFSIVSYTGTGTLASVGHGLNSAPAFLIIKARDSAISWAVLPNADTSLYLELNGSNASNSTDAANAWNSTAPTSSVFTIKTKATVNESGTDFIAYCFSPVSQYSAMGKYTGNGSADGPFVYTGMKPAFLLVKQSNAAQNWVIVDSERSPSNVVDKGLYADLSNAEQTSNRCDFLSNGFKIRINSGELNTNSGTYIYLAFAENPFKTARAR